MQTAPSLQIPLSVADFMPAIGTLVLAGLFLITITVAGGAGNRDLRRIAVTPGAHGQAWSPLRGNE